MYRNTWKCTNRAVQKRQQVQALMGREMRKINRQWNEKLKVSVFRWKDKNTKVLPMESIHTFPSLSREGEWRQDLVVIPPFSPEGENVLQAFLLSALAFLSGKAICNIYHLWKAPVFAPTWHFATNPPTYIRLGGTDLRIPSRFAQTANEVGSFSVRSEWISAPE